MCLIRGTKAQLHTIGEIVIRSAIRWLTQNSVRKLSIGVAIATAATMCAAGAVAGLDDSAPLERQSHVTHTKAVKGSSAKNSGKKNSYKDPHDGGSAPVPTPTPSVAVVTTPPPVEAPAAASKYPMHTGIVSTTFWVGEIFDANAADGSQMLSTYDANWFQNFGGCDGIASAGVCTTEKRVASNGFFPSSMTPKQNPFYLDLPYDDVNDPTGFKNRGAVIPWANDPGYAGKAKDRSVSFMKNRWVKLMKNGQTCYGQIADAGPGKYHDSAYVFGSNDARPANKRYGGAGMDVSPALNGCLGFKDLDGNADKVDWQFVEAADVPAGPWTRVTSSSMAVIN
jgi:hypothetical protein